MTDGKHASIQQLLQEYDIQDAKDIQNALKDLLGGIIKEMMEAEMDHHLGYEKSREYFVNLNGSMSTSPSDEIAEAKWLSLAKLTPT